MNEPELEEELVAHHHANTRHRHERGGEYHTHVGRRSPGGGIEWVTRFEDGTEQKKMLGWP